MSEIKRYSFDTYDGTTYENNLGHYVTFDDHEQEIKRLEAENGELKMSYEGIRGSEEFAFTELNAKLKEITKLREQLRIAKDALGSIEMNTRPERKANAETRIGVIAIEVKQALAEIEGVK